MVMNIFKRFFTLLCLGACLGLVGCAEMGLSPHKPNSKSTREISKTSGLYQIISVRGASSEMTNILDNDLMSCGSTTFHMPRGNTVGTFIKEVFEQELLVAQKLSVKGTPIYVVIKSLELETISRDSGVWTVEVSYTVNDKETNVKTIVEFESKVSMLTSCTHTATVFEDALADNLVEFFKKIR